MDKFLSLGIDGAITGTIYSLVAAGLVLSYSTTGIFNFSAGGIAFATGWFYYEINSAIGIPTVPAAILAIVVFAPLFGLSLDRIIFRNLGRATETAKIVGTVGLSVAIPALTIWLIERGISFFNFDLLLNASSGNVHGLGPFPNKKILTGNVTLNSDQLVTAVAAAMVALGLYWLLRHTRVGLNMRAAEDRPSLASLRGISPSRTSAMSWMIGTSMAGLAGVVAISNPIFGLQGAPYTQMLFIAATAAALGYFRSVPLAFAGGMLLGFLSSMVFGYLDDIWSGAASIPGAKESAPYWVLLVVLVVFGVRRGRLAGSVTAEVPPPDYLRDLPPWRRRLPWGISAALIPLFVFGWPPLGDQFLGTVNAIWFNLLLQGLALGLIFLSFVVVTGQGGMVSLAQTTFAAMGAVTAGYLIVDQSWPFLPAAIGGALAAMAIGVIVALPSLRLGGVALALATLALAFIGDRVLFQVDEFANVNAGGWSLARPAIGPFHFVDDRSFIILLLGLVLITAWLVSNLKRSASGRAIVAVRTADTAAATSGVSPLKTKLGLFAVSAFIAGVGGALYAAIGGSTNNPAVFNPLVGLFWVAVAVTFGVRRPGGVIVAGIVAQFSPQIINHVIPSYVPWLNTTSTQIPTILFGLGAIQLAKNPDGIVSLVGQQRWEKRRKKLLKAAAKRAESVVTFDEAEAEEVRLAALRSAEDLAIAAEVDRHATDLMERGILSVRSDDAAGAVVPTDSALVIEGLRSGYGEVEVLHGIGLVVPAGGITALFGANGAGKSTLCNTIGGLVTATEGSMIIEGRDISSLAAHARARAGVVVVPESRGIFPSLSVEENLSVWLRSPAEREQAFDAFPVLKQRRRLPAGNLSGGEQQMLTVAAVLVRPPKLLIADEPTLGLAPLVIDQLMRVFEDLRDRGVTLLLVEEKVRDILHIADTVALLELGHVIWSGPRSEVDDARLAAAYLGQSS